jgi:hypothetical protein
VALTGDVVAALPLLAAPCAPERWSRRRREPPNAVRQPRPTIGGVKERWTVRWFRQRALVYHLLVMILAPGCLLAGWWQIGRAESGNTLSYLYAIEWPVFAVLAVVGWWQLIHEDPAAVDSRKVERARRAANRGPFIPPPPEAATGFTHPLQPGSFGALGAGGGPGDGGPVPARRGDGDTPAAVGDEAVGVHALSSYNAYLARLSAGGGRKTWRNPHGITPATLRPPAPAIGGNEAIPAIPVDQPEAVGAGSGVEPPHRLGRPKPAGHEA